MTNIKQLAKRAILPALCVSLTSVLSVVLFWSNNAYSINEFGVMAKFLAGYALLGVLLLAILTMITKKVNKSALVASVFMFLFSFFTPLESLINNIISGFFYWHMVSIVLILTGAIAIVLYYMVSSHVAKMAANILSFMMAVLIIVNAVQIVLGAVSVSQRVTGASKQDTSAAEVRADGKDMPDVYFLLFDEMASNRFIEKCFGYDNSAMTDRLEDLGFTVSYTSQAEYYATAITTTNMVNLDYAYTPELLAQDTDENYRLRSDSPFFALFKDHGYAEYFFGSASWYGKESAVSSKATGAATVSGKGVADILLDNTMLYPVYSTPSNYLQLAQLMYAEIDYFLNEENFSHNPTLKFAHFMLPHAPYIFDRNGGEVSVLDTYNLSDPQIYFEQYLYASSLILKIAETITENDPNAIIVLISDHSFRYFFYPEESSPKEMTTMDSCDIFAAVYWGKTHEKINIEGLHSINIIRTLANELFGSTYEMIPYQPMAEEGLTGYEN